MTKKKKVKNEIVKNENKSIYYSYDELRSHQKLFNFILTGRGCGKTFQAKKLGIKDYLKSNGEQEFMYVRRYESEFEEVDKFFDDIIKADLFPNHEFTVKGNTGYCDKKVMCHFVALSTSLKRKSTAYPKVTKIFFDEFIISRKKQRYLFDEINTWLDLYSTVSRGRDVIAFFMANNVSYVNPYFSYFKFNIDKSKRFIKSPVKEDVILELYKNDDFIEKQKNTRFGRLIDGTSYGDFNLYNESLQDDECFIVPKMSCKRIFYCSFLYEGVEYGVWYVDDYRTYYVDKKINDTSKKRYSVTMLDHREGYINIRFARHDYRIKGFKELFGLGLIVFQSQEVKIAFYDILKYI